MRYPDFLRTAVLLFGGAATVLAVVAIAGASASEDTTLLYVSVGWWALATAIGLWLGARAAPSAGIERMMAAARTQRALPELEPGHVVVNRLWSLALLTIAGGAVAFLIPQAPAAGAGYSLSAALAWRRQSAAVEAVEGRDGVRFYVEPGSPFKPTQLVRTPGFHKVEPAEAEAERQPA